MRFSSPCHLHSSPWASSLNEVLHCSMQAVSCRNHAMQLPNEFRIPQKKKWINHLTLFSTLSYMLADCKESDIFLNDACREITTTFPSFIFHSEVDETATWEAFFDALPHTFPCHQLSSISKKMTASIAPNFEERGERFDRELIFYRICQGFLLDFDSQVCLVVDLNVFMMFLFFLFWNGSHDISLSIKLLAVCSNLILCSHWSRLNHSQCHSTII